MNSYSKLSYAIAAILGGAAGGVANAAPADPTTTSAADSDSIQEITVTAQRRNESLEDVPITIQALSGDTLKQLNVTSFDDLLRYTPNVTFSGNGPGTGNIFIRGLSSGGSGNQSQSTTAPFPNVALYLDDQSMQFPARNNDVYLVDMERVEILEGPQGTLFGGGAEAGAVRYITNKPKLDVTEGNANAGYGITAGGDPNSNLNATLNLPLIADTLAVRAVIFEDHRGGYINNVPGTICDPVITTVCANNAALIGRAENPQTYQGFRLSALLKINDDWNVLLQQNYQNMEADGYFAEYPNGVDSTPAGAPGCPAGCLGTALPNYSIQAFTPAYDKDKYESTAWTLNGKVSDQLRVVYSGSYMVRHIDQQADYSNYLRSGSGSLYDCTGTGAPYFKTAKPTTCYAPVGSWRDVVRNTHQSHEIRLSSNEENRIRGTGGVYWEQFDIYDDMNFNYLPIAQCSAANLAIAAAGGPDCLSSVGPEAGYPAIDPTTRATEDTAFGEDVHRGYRQTAEFVSLDFDVIPKVLTITGGYRHYHYAEYEQGSEYYSESLTPAVNPLVINHPNGACTAAGDCGFGINLNKTEAGSRSRGNITWHITPDMMVYYTYSQGFRPGGFNRTAVSESGVISLKAEIPYYANGTGKQYYKPVGFESDNLINNEIGFKSEFLDHRLQVNASTYYMHWNNIQLPLFSPPDFGNTTFTVNGPSYTVKGAELQIVARVTEGLTIQGSGSWNSSSQTNAPCLESDVPASKGNPTPQGTCVTVIKGQPLANAFGALGTSPAYSPSALFNLRARYDWTMGDYKPFASAGANHIGAERNEPASFTPGSSEIIPTTTLLLYTMPSYTTYDAAIGVGKDNWTAQINGSNLGNSSASTNTSSGQFIKSEVPLRPRVLTLLFGYKF
jgi:outer membrane receptor protein involved in Fe transport